MAFISYAQNFEDVMLWRALKHIENGFYVDIGAQHPVIDSVSKAFYDHGWRGIHIEPVPYYAELLRKDRPDETVLQVAIGDIEGTLKLNVIPDTGLSTAVDAYARQHQLERDYNPQTIQVPVLTLGSALRSLTGKDVHWLKIDVEGFEDKVLRGWDSQTVRPWIVVVEATIPNSPQTRYAGWDPILTAADYQFVYFDGLNRFYIAKEHAELVEAFSSPPNFFDDVVLSENSFLCQRLVALHQATEKELTTRIENVTGELRASKEETTSLLDVERRRTLQVNAELQGIREHERQLRTHVQWLEHERDTAKIKLEHERDTAKVKLEHERDTAKVKLEHERGTAKVKIDELNQSTHYWWTVADQLNRELQSVYASKLWRISRPLRKSMETARWILIHIVRALGTLERKAKSFVKWTVRTRLKSLVVGALANHPELKGKLRQKAIRLRLIDDRNATTSPVDLAEFGSGLGSREATILPYMPGEPVHNLSPRAARVFVDLKRSIGASRN